MGLKKLLGEFEIDKRSAYTMADVIRVFRILSGRPKGRISLMKELGLGEASVKTIIKNLRKHGLTRDSTKGEILTEKGREVGEYLNRKVKGIFRAQVPSISTKPTVAIVVKGASGKVKKGIEQRDEGMKMGVDVTTLVCEDGCIRFPGTGEVVKDIDLELKEKDVVVLASGKNLKEAERGGIAAVLTII